MKNNESSKNNKESQINMEVNTMEITVNFWVHHTRTEVITDGLNAGLNVTQEQFERMLASYLSWKYEYMNQDETLKDIVTALDEQERSKGYTDYETGLPNITAEKTLLFEYPDEVCQKAFETRTPLTEEEIAYYKGDRRVEIPEDDYKLVDLPDDVAKKAEADIVGRRQKRPREAFGNDAEYRLYLATLYDIAQLDEL